MLPKEAKGQVKCHLNIQGYYMTTKCYTKELEQAAITMVEKHIKHAPAYRFLTASNEPRLFIAIEAYKKRVEWPYSFSLEAVRAFDEQRPYLYKELLEAIKSSDKATKPALIQLAMKYIEQTSIHQ